MSTLVNFGGDNKLYNGRLFHKRPMDVYCPNRKRLRVSFPPGNETEEENRPSINDALPDECLFEIFRRMPSQERSICACVSKQWLSLMSSIRKADICNAESDDEDMFSFEEEKDDNGALSRDVEGDKDTDLRLLAMAVGTAGRGGLENLSIQGSDGSRGITDTGISAIARGCPTLKSLKLWSVANVGDEGLSEIAKGCPLLEKLDLLQCPSITSEGLIAIAEHCPNLSFLSIESCPRIGNDGLKAIGKHCTKLEMIGIKNCPSVGDVGIAGLTACSSLTKLKLNGLSISDFSLGVIGRYGRSIVHLSLINLKNVSQYGFWVMGNVRGLRSLTSLVISCCSGVTDLSIEAIGKGCPALKQMSLRSCSLVFDHGLIAFFKSATSLETLHLEDTNKITQSGIISALSICPSKLRGLSLVKCFGLRDVDVGVHLASLTPCRSLLALSIQKCPGFGCAGMAVMGKMCPEIRQLTLSGLGRITDEGLLSFIESREKPLVKLSLIDCFNLSDEAISAIVRIHGETIKLLNLDGCRKLTDLSMATIAESCQKLVDLDMSHTAITESGLAALSSASQLDLLILSVAGCPGVSDKSMPYLMKMGETLDGLNIISCTSLSRNAVDHLAENLWRCDILY